MPSIHEGNTENWVSVFSVIKYISIGIACVHALALLEKTNN